MRAGRLQALFTHSGPALCEPAQARPTTAGATGHHTPGMANGGAHLRKRVARQRRIGQKALAIHNPRQKATQPRNIRDDVEQPQRKYGKESKDSRH